jgi:hypothetical protein
MRRRALRERQWGEGHWGKGNEEKGIEGKALREKDIEGRAEKGNGTAAAAAAAEMPNANAVADRRAVPLSSFFCHFPLSFAAFFFFGRAGEGEAEEDAGEWEAKCELFAGAAAGAPRRQPLFPTFSRRVGLENGEKMGRENGRKIGGKWEENGRRKWEENKTGKCDWKHGEKMLTLQHQLKSLSRLMSPFCAILVFLLPRLSAKSQPNPTQPNPTQPAKPTQAEFPVTREQIHAWYLSSLPILRMPKAIRKNFYAVGGTSGSFVFFVGCSKSKKPIRATMLGKMCGGRPWMPCALFDWQEEKQSASFGGWQSWKESLKVCSIKEKRKIVFRVGWSQRTAEATKDHGPGPRRSSGPIIGFWPPPKQEATRKPGSQSVREQTKQKALLVKLGIEFELRE